MNKRLTSSARSVGIAVFLSRILGLVREQIFAALMGASNFSDAFFVAFRIPNIFRDLLGEGALSTAFIPTFTDTMINRSDEAAYRLTNLVVNSIIVIVGIFVAICMVFSPFIVSIIAPGFVGNSDKFNLTVMMTRIMFPFLPIISIASIFMGVLNAKGRFFTPAMGPALFNLAIITTGAALLAVGLSQESSIIYWAVGILAGGIAHLLIQVLPSFGIGYRYRFILDTGFKNKGLKRIMGLMAPAVVGLAATQFNIFINTILASTLVRGSISYLNYAFRLLYFPIGVIGVSVATANTAFISRNLASKDMTSMKESVAGAIKLNMFLTLPATVGLFLLSESIIGIIFEHGRFTNIDTINTAVALRIYTIGLVGYASVKILAPTFYALNRVKVPLFCSITAVLANLTISLSTYKVIGYRGLALGTTTAAIVNFLLLIIFFVKDYGWFKLKNFNNDILKIILSSISLFFFLLFLRDFVQFQIFGNVLDRLLNILIQVFGAILFYFSVAYLLGLREVKAIFSFRI